MNSTEHHHCRIESEAGPSALGSADSNANLTNRSQSNCECKGAIPKTKPAVKIKSTSTKKSAKLNNNIDETPDLTRVVQNDILQVNGVSFTAMKEDGLSDTESITTSNKTSKHKSELNSTLCDTIVSISKDPYDKCQQIRLDHFYLSDDDDALSISDDGCIYTYKGDQDADLPVSFFSLDMPIESPNPINRRQSSSPEMDFLEMDFDPGPPGDLDFDSTSNHETEIQNTQQVKNTENTPSIEVNVPTCSNSKTCENSIDIKISNGDIENKKALSKHTTDSVSIQNEQDSQNQETHSKMPWTCSISERTTAISSPLLTKKYHCLKGELVSPTDSPQKNGMPNCDNLYTDCCSIDLPEGIETAMIWTEQEAYIKQVTQIGPSACGATAVVNVLSALKIHISSVEKVKSCINTRLRSNSSPLTEYLLSRSVAGTTHTDLIDCLHKVTDGQVYARFFHMYPERIVNLRSWLTFWISKGAVPIATLNLQKCASGVIPDAWHHQMIFGVSSKGVFLCNPVECVAPELLWSQLCSESILLIRREDVLSRWNVKEDLPELMRIKSYKWRNINVVGQVANLVYESRRELRLGFKNTSHIKIPAAYSSGITLAIPVNSSSYSLLKHCPELPILNMRDAKNVTTK